MNRRVLWAGGSHLASAASDIRLMAGRSGLHADFFITAGGKVARWLRQGNQWQVCDQTVIKGFRDDRLSLNDSCDVAAYDAIVFLGQYIQPSRVFSDPQYDWDQPVSDAMMRSFARYSFENAPHPDFGRVVRNDVLKTFRSVFDATRPIFVFADPFVHEEACQERNPVYLRKVPLRIKRLYYEEFSRWAREMRTIPLVQWAGTCNAEAMATLREFAADAADDWHMNGRFWRLNLEAVLFPALVSAIDN